MSPLPDKIYLMDQCFQKWLHDQEEFHPLLITEVSVKQAFILSSTGQSSNTFLFLYISYIAVYFQNPLTCIDLTI